MTGIEMNDKATERLVGLGFRVIIIVIMVSGFWFGSGFGFWVSNPHRLTWIEMNDKATERAVVGVLRV